MYKKTRKDILKRNLTLITSLAASRGLNRGGVLFVVHDKL